MTLKAMGVEFLCMQALELIQKAFDLMKRLAHIRALARGQMGLEHPTVKRLGRAVHHTAKLLTEVCLDS